MKTAAAGDTIVGLTPSGDNGVNVDPVEPLKPQP